MQNIGLVRRDPKQLSCATKQWVTPADGGDRTQCDLTQLKQCDVTRHQQVSKKHSILGANAHYHLTSKSVDL